MQAKWRCEGGRISTDKSDLIGTIGVPCDFADMTNNNSPGRKANSAQPLGDRDGTDSKEATKRTGERERQSAGPDGPAATVIGNTFKKKS